jgi:tellurium resistance protein TerZ
MPINLTKGQKISLAKEGGAQLTKIVMGLGWDPIKVRGLFGFGARQLEVDLDASCLMFDESKTLLDTVYFGQLKSKDGSIIHTGDNRTGAGEGDDEQIKVDLSRVPQTVKTLVFVVNSFSGQNFSQIENATCRIVDEGTGREIANYNLTGTKGSHNAQVMAKLYRHGGEWKMHAIGEIATGRTFHDILPVVNQFL